MKHQLFNQHKCTDDYGDVWYSCIYTGILTHCDNCTKSGSLIPGVKVNYFISKSPESLVLHKQNQVSFHESEASCNTCTNLNRLPHPKNKFGFVEGSCLVGRIKGKMQIHPEDPMHIPCYVSRFKK
jgi:hypothetical protein